MKKREVSLTTQAIIIISLLLLVANVIMGVLLMTQSKNAMKTLINRRMLDISNTAAATLDGDVLERLTAEDRDTEEYRTVERALRVFQEHIDLQYIYCIMQKDDGSFVFGIDPTVGDPGVFGEPVVCTEALKRAALGTPSVDEEPYQDAWGTFYSAYTPVFDSQNRVAGIVAVDFSASWYDDQLRQIVLTILLSSFLSSVFGVLIVLVVTARVRRRIRSLNSELRGLSSEVDKLTCELNGGKDPEREASGRPDDSIVELSERIHATRTELLHYAEHMQTRANSMITALASDYSSVYYIDLDSDEGICYRARDKRESALSEGETFAYYQTFVSYGERYVAEPFREEFLQFIAPENIRRALAHEAIISLRYLALHDGGERYEMLRMAGVRHPEDRDDHIVHAIGLGFTDVDAETRKAMERSRTLSDALAVAEASDRAKTAFLSNMSHEIRTPMNAIIGLDNIALSDPDVPEKTRGYLEKIGDSAKHLLNIINDILDMSRVKSGRVNLNHEEFSFTAMVEQVNSMVSIQCGEKQINFNSTLDDDVASYYIGDEVRLRQILLNILGNAVKFTPEGGSVHMDIARVAHFDKKTTLRFTVSDTGIGMEQSFLAHIFDPFSQEDSSSTNRYGSTGLGMAIAKSIVDMMDGNIEAESEKGKGSVFRVTLTLHDSEENHSEPDGESIKPQELRVLVVDDDEVALEHTRLVLQHVGFETETASSGAQALEKAQLRHARRERFDVIFLDRKTPGMDGIETARRLRETIGSETAIIMLTACKWDDVIDGASKAGVDSFMTKPLFSAHLFDTLRGVLLRKRAAGAAVRKAELSGRHILLAEDMIVNAEIMMMVLGMREMIVDHAENGRIAVEMFASHPEGYYDAILMDIRMPEMDGLEATAAIRAMERADSKTVPIIALTANAFDEDVKRSLQVSMNAHLSKPVDPEKLFETLETSISPDPKT